MMSNYVPLCCLVFCAYICIQEFICAGGCGKDVPGTNSSLSLSSPYLSLDSPSEHMPADELTFPDIDTGIDTDNDTAGQYEQREASSHAVVKSVHTAGGEGGRVCHGGVNDGMDYGTYSCSGLLQTC